MNGNTEGGIAMTVTERISLCRFLEKIEEQEAYCAAIGVRDVSKFHGRELAQCTGDTENDKKYV